MTQMKQIFTSLSFKINHILPKIGPIKKTAPKLLLKISLKGHCRKYKRIIVQIKARSKNYQRSVF